MKLLSCHVENFGKIKNQDYDFSNPITAIYKENGAGKSTLASFIKAMFYGLESYKINSMDFCDRQHYYPFDGGNFGGNITFIFGSNTYKIERFFGEKSQTQDTLVVYKNGDLTDELGEDIGKTVFGVDKQSFERTAFIGGEEIEIKSTSSINSKLNNFLQGGDDFDVDDAVLSLEKLAKEYKKSNKAKDKISEATEEIARLNVNIVNTEAIATALEGKYAMLNQIKAEISDLSAKALHVQKQSKELSDWEHYERILKEIENAQQSIKSIELKYGGVVPSKVEAQNVSERHVLLRELSAKAENGLSPDEEARLYKFEKAFSIGIPSGEDMLAAQTSIDEIKDLSAQLSACKNQGLTSGDDGVYKTFSHNPPSAQKIEALNKNVESYKALKSEYDRMPDYYSSAKRVGGLKYGISAIISLVVLIVGLCTLSSTLGIALTVVGGLALLLTGFLYLSDKSSKTTVDNLDKRRLDIDVRAEEDKIKAMLIPYGYSSGNGILYDYAVFTTDYNRYLEISNTIEDNIKASVEIEQNISKIKQNLALFFANYGLNEDNYINNLSRLQSGLDEFYSLKKRAENVLLNADKTKKESEKIKGEIDAFLIKYNISSLNPNEVMLDVNAYESASKSLTTLQNSASEFRKEKELTEKPQPLEISLDDINSDLTNRQRDFSLLKHQIVEDEYAVDRLDGYYIDRKNLEEKLASYKQTHKLLTETCSLLRLAEQNLKDKYVKPVKDEFIKYANLIEEVLGEKVTMTKNFELRFERAGKERVEKHLSSGNKAICAFCFRIAMIKNMYKDAMPFLVLDDPFVNLDENHLEKVKKVLKELSLGTQIIYFTCHASRDI